MIEFSEEQQAVIEECLWRLWRLRTMLGIEDCRHWGRTTDWAELWVNILLSQCYDRFPIERCVIYPNAIERLGMAEMVKEGRN